MNKSTKSLAVLIVEDLESDAQLIVRLLKKTGYELVYERVETAEQMRTTLEKHVWDIVISDYKLPQFDGRAALKLLQEMGRDIPFIVLSGTISEETAVSMMKAGAHDYLAKGDLARLVPAMERELEQSEIRRQRKQAEEKLQQEDYFLSEAQRIAHIGSWVGDIATGRVAMSEEMYRIFGVSPETFESTRDSVINLIHPEDRETLERQFDAPNFGKKHDAVEVRVVLHDGSVRFISAIGETFFDKDGKPVRIIGTSQDITERVRAEKALAESEIKFRWLYEYAPVAYHLLTPDGTITDVNRRWCEVLGFRREEVIGKAIFDFVVDDEKDEAKASFEKKKRSKLSFIEGSERKFLTRNGAVKIFKTYDFFVLDQKQNITAIQTTIEDITERAQAEEALRLSEKKYRTLFDALPDAITLLGLNGHIIECNEATAELAGVPKEKLIGRHFTELGVLDVKEIPKYLKLFSQLLAGKQESYVEVEVKHGDEHHRLEVFVNLLTVSGHFHTIQVIARDITPRKRAEEALRASEERFRTLIMKVSNIAVQGYAPDGTVKFWNKASEEIYGYTAEEALGKNLIELIIPPEMRPGVKDAIQQMITSGEGNPPEELTLMRKDGSPAPVYSNHTVIDISGQGKELFCIDVDLKERRRAEEALRASEERYRGLFNGMIDGFALHEIICDENGKPVDYRFLEVNPAFERLTKLQSFNLIGKTMLEVMPDTESNWIDIYGNVALTGRSTFFENYSRELDRFFEVSAYCPQLGQFAVIMVDITDRKKAEDNIQQRVVELETLNRISIVLRGVTRQDEMLAIVLDEALAILNTSHGSIQLHNKATDNLDKPIFRGWTAQVAEQPHKSSEGITGKVFTSGETYISREFASDPEVRAASRSQIPSGWGGICLPIRTTQQTLGVMIVSVPSERELNKDEIRLLATLSEMAGAAIQRMQLHEETARRAQEFKALYDTSQALSAENELGILLKTIVEHARALLGAESSGIYLYDEASGDVEVVIDTAHHLPIGSRLRLGEGMAGRVAQTRQPLRVENYSVWEGRSLKYDNSLTRAVLEVPMLYGGELVGVLTANEVGRSERLFTDADEHLLSLFASQAAGAIHSARLHEETVHRLEHLQALRAVDQAIASSLDMHLTLNILLTHTLSQLGVDAADVLLLHSGSNLLEFTTGRGFRTRMSEGASVGVGESFAGRAIMEHRTIMALDLKTAENNPQFGKFWKEEGFSCCWCVPLIAKGEVRGVLEVYRRTAFNPDPEWLEFLETLAGQAAIAIENTQLFENLQRANIDLNLAYNATIEGWSRAMDMRDQETEGHTQRVADLTITIAKAMGIKDRELLHVRHGALLHDIGKMGIPDYILLKPEKLTNKEWAIMQTHPQLARDMLMPISYLREALDIPYSHHEKWDGTGYPQGLKGQHIPLSARLFAIVDVWDALTSNRPYRKKWTKKKALAYIHEQRGKCFDPQIVDVFIKIIK